MSAKPAAANKSEPNITHLLKFLFIIYCFVIKTYYS